MANGDFIKDALEIYENDPKSVTQKYMLQVAIKGLAKTLDNDKTVNESVMELSASVKSLSEDVKVLANCHSRLEKEIDGDPGDRKDGGMKSDVAHLIKWNNGILWALKIAGGVVITGLAGMLIAGCA